MSTATVDVDGNQDYASLDLAAEAIGGTTLSEPHTIICTSHDPWTADTTYVDGFWDVVTSAANYILVTADVDNKAVKTGYSASKYRLAVVDDICIQMGTEYLRFDGIQVKTAWSAGGNQYAFRTESLGATHDLRIMNCWIDGDSNKGDYALSTSDADTDNILFYNNIVVDWVRGLNLAYGANLKIYNNIIYDITNQGIITANGVTVIIKNNAIWNTEDDIDNTGGATVTVQYNAADDDLDTEFTETTNLTPANWASEYATPPNFTLLAGGSLADAGVGPTTDAVVPVTDIDGTTRSGTTCDIGPDEIASAGGPPPASVPYLMQL